jgi:SAM-dependent methyltransferase
MEETTEEQRRNKLLALYDAAPYPDCLGGNTQQNNPLLTHWINAANGFAAPVLANDSHILVAGCGTGAEAFVLAKLYPQARIVGLDFSAPSIEKAKTSAQENGFVNITFAVADLMAADWWAAYPEFDFVLCYGVADYVLDPALLLQHFAQCLSEKGLIYIACNSEYHPAMRIRAAFAQLDIEPDNFVDSDEQRALLQLVAQVMGADAKIADLGKAAKAYLDIDIFPPIAHHNSIEKWVDDAQKAGLRFAGSANAASGLLSVSDSQIPMLYSLDKADLSRWFLKLTQPPAMQLLFCRQAKNEPNFANLDALWQWRPRLDACLHGLPDLADNANAPLSITLRFENTADFVIYSNAYDLAVLRRCDGSRTLAEIREEIAVEGNSNSLLACLFRAFHYGLLSS